MMQNTSSNSSQSWACNHEKKMRELLRVPGANMREVSTQMSKRKARKIVKVVYAPIVTVGEQRVSVRMLRNETAAAHGVVYLEKVPALLPSGVVLVHNNGRPRRRLGRIFRAWLQKQSDGLEPVRVHWCGFPHYRVRRDAESAGRNEK